MSTPTSPASTGATAVAAPTMTAAATAPITLSSSTSSSSSHIAAAAATPAVSSNRKRVHSALSDEEDEEELVDTNSASAPSGADAATSQPQQTRLTSDSSRSQSKRIRPSAPFQGATTTASSASSSRSRFDRNGPGREPSPPPQTDATLDDDIAESEQIDAMLEARARVTNMRGETHLLHQFLIELFAVNHPSIDYLRGRSLSECILDEKLIATYLRYRSQERTCRTFDALRSTWWTLRAIMDARCGGRNYYGFYSSHAFAHPEEADSCHPFHFGIKRLLRTIAAKCEKEDRQRRRRRRRQAH